MSDPNWKNRTLFHGDNLSILRAMNSGSVDLIATDPPFKKGRDFHATPDSLAHGARFQDRWSWERDVHQEWVDKIKDDFPAVWEVIDAANAVCMRRTKKNLTRPREEVGSDMGAFLCFMAVRLLEMQRVLKPTGSIFLHCDPTASHYLKAVMDAVFGRKQFRNEIVWDYSFRLMDLPSFFNRKHDNILFYAKSPKAKFSMLKDQWTREEIIKTRKQKVHLDEAGNELIWMPGGKGHSKSRLKKITDILQEGKAVSDVWSIPIISSSAKERTGYPTQKPLILYDRIIQASSSEGDVVLDPFCGCATTCVAAELSHREWAGIDIWDRAHKVVLDRFREEYFEAEGHAGGRFPFDKVYYLKRPPKRTDDGQIAVPFLKVKERTQGTKESPMKRSAMYAQLLVEQGRKCQGCDRYFDDPRYLELDHRLPRSEGGSNEIPNRILLCGPCNRLKSNTLTLTGLRRQNKKEGCMADSEGEHPIMKKHRESYRTAPRSLFE